MNFFLEKKRKYTLRKLLCAVLAIVLCITCLPFNMVFAADTMQIPGDAVKFNGHYYKAYNTSKSWTSAKSYCEDLGGHLATINSKEEQSFIVETFLSKNPAKKCYFLGGYRSSVSSSVWYWVTGEPFTYSNWGGGENTQSDVYGQIYTIIASSISTMMHPYQWYSHMNYDTGTSTADWAGKFTGFICEWETDPTYEIYGREFDNNLDHYAKELDSSAYNPTLANMMAALSAAVYSQEDIEAAYESLGFEYCSLFDYDELTSWDECGYSIAFKKSDCSDDIICLVTVRGSKRLEYNDDWLGNFNIATDAETGHHLGFSKPADRIYDRIQRYIESTQTTANIKYFVTGHSRGAAVANLLSVKLMDNGTSSKDVYNYNFACPDVACKNIFVNSDNMFNLCNREDIVPYIPSVLCDSLIPNSSYSWDKYGQTYWFTKDDPDTVNPLADHDMDLYLEFFDQQLTPSDPYAYFSDQSVDPVNKITGCTTIVCCPVDVIITDKGGKRIASVIDGKADYYDSNFGDVIIFTDGDKKVIFIAGDKEFDVELIGTDIGEMTYTVERYILQTEEVLESKTFSNVTLEDGKEMVSSVNSKGNMSEIELLVTKEENGKSIITHNIDTDGTETECYWINVKDTQIAIPSVSTINYGETLVLSVGFGEGSLPESYSVNWSIDGTGVTLNPSEDGLTCNVTSTQSGTVTVKATIVDEEGNAILDTEGNEITAEQQLTSKAGFFQKLISFFKNLFGINRIIY